MKQILLLDDNDINLLILEHHASMLGLCSKRFTEPLKALAYLETSTCDIIITDYMMPVMDGLSFVRALKDMNIKDVPIILSTAVENDDGLKEKAIEVGIDAFLPKPIDPTLFRTSVMALLKKRKSEIWDTGEKTPS